MVHPTRAICTLTAVLALALTTGRAASAQRDGGDKKPSLSLKASPPVGFAPLRVRVTVDLRGGPDDYADLYCPAVEWQWGDDVVSENSGDCDPYQAGKSSIQRHYHAEHIYRQQGTYRITFRLKQKDRVIAVGNGNVQVRSGLRDDFGG
jgi:hypothetical protein